MKEQLRKAVLLGGVVGLTAAMTGCYGYGYGSYNNTSRIPKTTAARDTLEEFNLASFRAADGMFQMEGLPWGSSIQEVEEVLGMSVGQTVAYSDGGGYADVNYSLLLMDKISLGLMPVFDVDDGLACLTFYFENTYTAEELDTLYADLTKQCTSIFGEPDEKQEDERTAGNTTYSGVTLFWYHEVSDTQMTTFQLGKLDTGNGTETVILGINTYDPNEIEAETSTGEEETRADKGENTKDTSGAEEQSGEIYSSEEE